MTTNESKPLQLNDPQAVKRLLDSMYQAIKSKAEQFDKDDIVMIGIHTGGLWIAEQLYKKLDLSTPLGSLNISFYRDEWRVSGIP